MLPKYLVPFWAIKNSLENTAMAIFGQLLGKNLATFIPTFRHTVLFEDSH